MVPEVGKVSIRKEGRGADRHKRLEGGSKRDRGVVQKLRRARQSRNAVEVVEYEDQKKAQGVSRKGGREEGFQAWMT